MSLSNNSIEIERHRSLTFFMKRWGEIEKVVDYDVNWQTPMSPEDLRMVQHKGFIEYNLRDLFNDPQFKTMQPGETAKTMDDSGRKFIFVQTRLGIWSFFIVSKNVSDNVIGDLRSDRLAFTFSEPVVFRASSLARYIGSPNGLIEPGKYTAYNIGERLEHVAKMFADPELKIPERGYLLPRKKKA